jgi:HTH-type transcriptional regulator/antitoxin HigA
MKPLSPETERYLYELVLKRIDLLMDAKPGSKEGAELEFLTTVAEAYEEEHFPMRPSK